MPLLAKADRLPPFVVRIIAREKNGRKPLSYTAIANLAGVSRSRAAAILLRKSWKDVPMETADKLAGACGVDLAAPYAHLKWLKKTCLVHMRNGSSAQKRMFSRLFKTRI